MERVFCKLLVFILCIGVFVMIAPVNEIQARDLYVKNKNSGSSGERKSVYIPPKVTNKRRVRSKSSVQDTLYNRDPYRKTRQTSARITSNNELDRLRQDNIRRAVSAAEKNQKKINREIAKANSKREKQRQLEIAEHRKRTDRTNSILTSVLDKDVSGRGSTGFGNKTVIQKKEPKKVAPRIFNVFD